MFCNSLLTNINLIITAILLVLSSVLSVPLPEGHLALHEEMSGDDTIRDMYITDDKDVKNVIFEGDIIMSAAEMAQVKGTDDVNEDIKIAVKRSVLEVIGSGLGTGSGLDPILPSTNPTSNPNPPTIKPIGSVGQIWPRCTVPYKFDPSLSAPFRMKFMIAMEWWEEGTCIKFEYARMDAKDYLLLKKTDICSSEIGRQGGVQEVTIADGCSKVGHAAHELGHAIGLWHEHSRIDRDKYIEIMIENVANRRNRVFFEKMNKKVFEMVPDVGYDIQSIMHYSPYAFGIIKGTDKRTIKIREDANLPELNCTNRLPMGQRERLSYKDKLRASLLYSCNTENLTEPPCELPTPTPTITRTPPPTTTATPTIATTATTPTMTMPTPSTTSKLSKRLKSGNVIALTFGDGGFGMKCVPSPGCTPLPCRDRAGNTCKRNDNQFQIINHMNISARKILSGSTILLRSVNSPSNWLDCSSPNKCTISTCPEDNVEEPSNSSYISNCSRHHFQVFGVDRKLSQILNINHKLRFRSNSDKYLNCNGKRCKLLQEDNCRTDSTVAPIELNEDRETCEPQNFTVLKISEK